MHSVISLDTGALWGGQLTAINLDTEEITQVQAANGIDWKSIMK